MEGRLIAPDHQHLDQTAPQSFLGLYTQLCLCYPIPDPSYHATIIAKLQDGLEKLSSAFPWVAGQVSKEGNSIKMVPLARTPRLVVKDFINDPSFPTMTDYRAAKFPFSMLDESVICPVNTLPGDFAQGSAPIFLIQVNFIVGGLLLTFTAEHGAMDMTGQAQIISLLSKACKGEELTSSEVADGNGDRRKTIKLLEDYKIGPELDNQVKGSATAPISKNTDGNIEENVVPAPEGQIAEPKEGSTSYSQPECLWAYFSFSNESLTQLKSLAASTITSRYVSTDDTISAFIWQLVARARLLRLPPNTQTTFARAIDARRFVGVSKTYLGLLNNMTYHKHSLEYVSQASLGTIASELRRAVDPMTSQLEYNTRAYATAFTQSEDKSILGPVINLQVDKDVMLSSWASINSYELDFGFGLGKPESVRRPRLAPVESLMYLMPRDRDGNSAAAVSLREEDMNAIRIDPEFVKYAAYVG